MEDYQRLLCDAVYLVADYGRFRW